MCPIEQKPGVSVATRLGWAVLLVVLSAGCASNRTGGVASTPGEGFAQSGTRGFSVGSAVSPLGDAPGERDLELTRVWPAERPPATVAYAATEAGLARAR